MSNKVLYNIHLLLQSKNKLLIKILVYLIIYSFINENNISHCMMEDKEPFEIKQPDIIETLQDQILHLSSENIQLQKEITTNHLKIDNQTNEIIELQQEIVELKDEIARLEIVIREHYTSCPCKCNIL